MLLAYCSFSVGRCIKCMNLSKADLQAIRGVVKEELSQLELKIDARFEEVNAKFSAMKKYIDISLGSVKEELLGHIDGLAVMMSTSIQSNDKRIVENTNQIHGIKDFLKLSGSK